MDTIKIRIYREDIPEVFYRGFFEHYEFDTRFSKRTGMMTYHTEIKNFQVRLDDRQLVLEGSLTKFAIGDNLKTADLVQLYEGIAELGKELRVDLFRSEVLRLDIAGNIITKYPVKEYYSLLIDLPRFKRNEMNNGLSFSNSTAYVSFYGKIQEMKGKRSTFVDDFFSNANVLRFECKFNSRSFEQYFNLRKPTLNDVFENYDKFISQWQRIFKAIVKAQDALHPSTELFSVKGNFERFLKIQGIEKLGGLRVALDLIELGKKRGYLTKYGNEASNLKGKLKKLMKLPQLVQKSTLVEELEQKVDFVAFHLQN